MLLSAYIGQRLSLRPGSGKRASAGTFVAVTGITLAIVIMAIAIAVVTGFKKEIQEKVVGFNSEIAIYPADSYSDSLYTSGLTLNSELLDIIADIAPEAKAELMVRQPAILKTDSAFQGIVLKGMTPGAGTDFLNKSMVAGEAVLTSEGKDSLLNTIVISQNMADALGLNIGDRVNTHFLLDNNVRTRKLTISGIYNTYFSDYDKLYAFAPIEFLQRFNHIDSLTGNALELRGIDIGRIPDISSRLEAELIMDAARQNRTSSYHITDVLETNALYFNWLDLLDTNVAVIIILMTIVSAFTLISSLFIIILERVNMIGLMKALGATNSLIRKIFIYMSERLVIRGIIIGDILAIGIILLQQHTHFLHLDPEAYYLSYVPVEFNWWYLALLNIGVIIVSCAVLIIPSAAISRMTPAKTLRYE